MEWIAPVPGRTNLEAVMTVQGRKQRWLADRLGVHESEVSRYMNGSKPMPVELVQQAAEILGVPPELLQPTAPPCDPEPIESAAD